MLVFKKYDRQNHLHMQHLKVGLKILNALSFQLYCGGARITGVLGETTDLPKEPYKHYHITLHRVHLATA
jgi:hypothetical protein